MQLTLKTDEIDEQFQRIRNKSLSTKYSTHQSTIDYQRDNISLKVFYILTEQLKAEQNRSNNLQNAAIKMKQSLIEQDKLAGELLIKVEYLMKQVQVKDSQNKQLNEELIVLKQTNGNLEESLSEYSQLKLEINRISLKYEQLSPIFQEQHKQLRRCLQYTDQLQCLIDPLIYGTSLPLDKLFRQKPTNIQVNMHIDMGLDNLNMIDKLCGVMETLLDKIDQQYIRIMAMSRKPIFQSDLKQSQMFSTGRQADTRVNAMRKTELNLMNYEKGNQPFSGFSTATQSQEQLSSRVDENSPLVQTVVKTVREQLNEETTKKLMQSEGKSKEMQNQIDVLRNMVMEIRGSDKMYKQIGQVEESLSGRIQKAQEELMKHQEQFQQNHIARLNDIRNQCEQTNTQSTILDAKFKQLLSKNEKDQQENQQRNNILEEQMIAQFKTFQNSYQNYIMNWGKKLSDEFDTKLMGLQQQIQQKTFQQSSVPRVEQVNYSTDIMMINNVITELQNSNQLQQQQVNELLSKQDSSQQQLSRLESNTKVQNSKVQQLKEDYDSSIINTNLELARVSKQIQEIAQQLKHEIEVANEQHKKQTEELRQSYQEMLFSFKPKEDPQVNWVEQYQQKYQEVASHQVQVYSFEDDNEYVDNKFIEVEQPIVEHIKTESDMVEIGTMQGDNKESFQQQEKVIKDGFESIAEQQDEDDEEVTYQLDDHGNLMDDNGNYILDDDGQMIQLTESQIEYLRQQKMVQDEDD